jgi:hypothetical protein
MWKSYLKIALRNLLKNKLHTGINLVGLSLGLGVSILIFFFVQQEMNFDSFHQDGERIFRMKRYEMVEGLFLEGYSTPAITAPAVKAEFPEIETLFGGQKIIHKQNWPKIITYVPIENYWLSQSRSNKLSNLDNLLSQIFEDAYSLELSKLKKFVTAKQRLLKKQIQERGPSDESLILILSEQIYSLSVFIWEKRKLFFEVLMSEIATFSNWINGPIKNSKLIWEITDHQGRRTNFTDKMPPQPNWLKLWQKELIVGKTLFGATRDDFRLEINHKNIESLFSRGEMRLFVIFIKSLVYKFDHQNSNIWWFLDDVFNELDQKREEILFSNLISKSSFYITTGTKNAATNITNYSLSDLTDS